MGRLFAFLERRPTLSFIVILILLFGLIALAVFSRTPANTAQERLNEPKTSRVFSLRESGIVTATAQVKKTSVLDIVSVTGGTVQAIPVRVGQVVPAGATLALLTNDYGTNASRLSAQKTALESNFTERVFSLEKEINEREQKIKKNDSELSQREEKNAVNNLKLELERLRLGRETAKLDRAIANASDAVLRPKSWLSGSVEYIGVRVGETINPGTLIATLRTSSAYATLSADLPNAMASVIRPEGVAQLVLGSERVTLTGGYIAKSENSLGLRSITFPLDSKTADRLTASEFVTLSLPLINPTNGYFVPIDTILSGAQGKSVLVLRDGHAIEQAVTTDIVVGSYVLITSGLSENDTLLLNRGLLPGDPVTVVQ